MEHTPARTRAQESRAAIEKIYINMRHLFNRGFFKPFGASGLALRESLLVLAPEIYGSIADTEKVELEGLVYVMDRLPKGIEGCRFIRMSSSEGYEHTKFPVIIPAKRRRNCYKIDNEQMVIELTRGRSEIYDVLTHLTFLYLEAEKIKNHAKTEKGQFVREWLKLEARVTRQKSSTEEDLEMALVHLSTLLGRTFDETENAYERLKETGQHNTGLFEIVYWLGKKAMDEEEGRDREITFSPALRERIGHHIYGEMWANEVKKVLKKNNLHHKPLHIISANMHSVMNSLYAREALKSDSKDLIKLAKDISLDKSGALQQKVHEFAVKNGLIEVHDKSGTNVNVQIIDLEKINKDHLHPDFKNTSVNKEVILVMDYAFGEQAFETMDELLKPQQDGSHGFNMSVKSINILGKAGILTGNKGDIMVPTAHIFEGTADNYPFDNVFTIKDFEDENQQVFEGPMVTVLGTSLQNKDVLSYFKESSWGVIGLEMEGAHLQKAIQAASKIRKSISSDVKLRYAYYASDNPLVTGNTLASGSLGVIGVRPTYLITKKIIEGILTHNN